MTRHRSDAPPKSGGPREPHAFRETVDPGIGAVAAGGDFRFGADVHAVAATSGFLRSTRCAFPGCGRPREDPIHDPVDE